MGTTAVGSSGRDELPARVGEVVPVEAPSPAHSIDACCTLPADAIEERLARWHALAESADRVRVEGGVELIFERPAPTAAEIAALADAERSCCSFFRFDLALDGSATRLRITAPDAALVDELLGVIPDAPTNGACSCCG
jgi:hypothetical protein